MPRAVSGARPFGGRRGPVLCPLAEGLVKPAAERRDEFPPRGDGGPECRPPAHRSGDGERSAGAGLGGKGASASFPSP